MNPKLHAAISQMLADCPKCKGVGSRPKWNPSPGYYDQGTRVPCPYCGTVRRLFGEETLRQLGRQEKLL